MAEVVAASLKFESVASARKQLGKLDFQALVADFALKNANATYQSTAISDAAGRTIVEAREASAREVGVIHHLPRQGYEDIYTLVSGKSM